MAGKALRRLRHDGPAERANEFCKQLFLTLRLVSIVLYNVLPDLNLFGGFQLDVLGQSTILDSIDWPLKSLYCLWCGACGRRHGRPSGK